jgi:hypothetical protein
MSRLTLFLFLSLLLIPIIVIENLTSDTNLELPPIGVDTEPDPSKAIRLERWATKEEGDRFFSARGKPKWKVLQILGHPWTVEKRADKTEVWSYAWGVDWRLFFKNGICVYADANDGY